MTEAVLTAFEDGVLEITLNRPERLNAFVQAMHEGLRAAMDRAESDPEVRAVLLTGAGRGFSAGQDLQERDPRKMKERGEWPPDLGDTLETNFNPFVMRMRRLPKPIVCAVNGVAAGAGANLALASDIVLAAKSAKFIQAFAKLGLVPDAGGTYWLTRHLGEARAKALAFTADPLPAETAAEWGLIWKAVDDDALMDEARALARRLADGAVHGLGLTKAAIQAASENGLEAQLAVEAARQREAAKAGEYEEGTAAFLEKRPADFRKLG